MTRTPRCERCRRDEPHRFEHGENGYKYHACSCDICRKGHAERNRRRRAEIDPELRKARGRAYYHAHGGLEYQRGYIAANRPRVRARDRAYKEANAERIIADSRIYGRAYYEANRDQILADAKRWRDENPDSARAMAQRFTEKTKAVKVTRSRHDSWTPGEDAIVMRNDLKLLEIACILGRSYSAVGGRRNKLKVSQ